MKRFLILYSFVSLYGLGYLTSTKIEPTTNEILFKPLGSLIPELSWAIIRTKISITDMFKEPEEVCKASSITDKEYIKMGKKVHRSKN